MGTEKIALIRDRARKNFSKGFNCAECVVEQSFSLGGFHNVFQ